VARKPLQLPFLPFLFFSEQSRGTERFPPFFFSLPFLLCPRIRKKPGWKKGNSFSFLFFFHRLERNMNDEAVPTGSFFF